MYPHQDTQFFENEVRDDTIKIAGPISQPQESLCLAVTGKAYFFL